MNCCNPDADKPRLIKVRRKSLTADEVQVATRRHQGEEERHSLMAVLARQDSLVGVTFDGSHDVKLICVTEPRYQIPNDTTLHCKTRKKDFLPGDDILEGKILNRLTNPLSYTFNRAKAVIFAADEVLTSPVQHEVNRRNACGEPLIVTIDEELETLVT